jgi:hypothetical protein
LGHSRAGQAQGEGNGSQGGDNFLHGFSFLLDRVIVAKGDLILPNAYSLPVLKWTIIFISAFNHKIFCSDNLHPEFSAAS